MNDQQRFDHAAIEKKWADVWLQTKLYRTDIDGASKPYYNLMMFPYPSAEGLHVGNMYAFTGSDIHGRFMAMQGYDVFEPIGLDGFGIHSENYALKVGRHPKQHAQITEKRFYEQLTKIGAMFDPDRKIETYDADYYRWTQWMFTTMFKHGLAYRSKAAVNWCPGCKTVLADEQVLGKTVDGVEIQVCERCGNKVEKRALEQWFFRITAYAGKLLENISKLNWSEKVKVSQENWIGKKEGIDITYPVVDADGNDAGSVVCFTTRPDTNFGATFIVIAPEHPISQKLAATNPDVSAYVKKAVSKSETERIAEGRTKTGVATGLFCINRLNNTKLPLYISDFVLAGFGTGAVVGVPGHDLRDFEFATTFGLPVVRVVVGPDGDRSTITTREQVQEDEGTMVNSGFLDGMSITDAIPAMMDHLEKQNIGHRTASYHLRDWLVSRQRYWGPPIPMIYCAACAKQGKSWFTTTPEAAAIHTVNGSAADKSAKKAYQDPSAYAGWYPVPDADLPVELPDIEDYKPGDDGVAPLAKHKEFYETTCPGCGQKAVRETDVSDTFLDSSWYFLRYPSIRATSAQTAPFDPATTARWLPVSMYTGGAEHSVLHLMYSRFMTMALKDFGYVGFDEPFGTFFAHGLVIKDGAKMSKSKGNVVNPDEYIASYGADALRMYLMFMGPFSDGGDFRDAAMEGMSKWVGRVWRLIGKSATDAPERTDAKIERLLHRTIQRVSEDMPKRRYNTAIATLMEFTNTLKDADVVLALDDAKRYMLLLAPLAPHLAEEMWQRLNGRETYNDPNDSVHRQRYPLYNKELVIAETIPFVVQINGKLRDTLSVSPDDAKNQQHIEALVAASEKASRFITGGTVRKIIFVPGKLINYVVS